MPNYTLSVTNHATFSANICLYYVFEQLKDPSALTYIYMSAPSVPETSNLRLVWEPGLQFMWRIESIDAAEHGIHLNQMQVTDAQLTHSNGVNLSRNTAGGYQLSPTFAAFDRDRYYISADRTIVPHDHAFVGIAQNGAPLVAVKAHPNTMTAFHPRPRLYLTYGFWQAGDIITPDMYTDYSLKLDYETSTHLVVTISSLNELHVTDRS
ncbi:hypothetical protein [Paenibacillus massiliensis]|uniref:hypothetical protein n=1 Tax=Paenibacillus massiliensis TaxID=225917 RepID=UPI00047299A6|nr:hypothetical protein [Paenibacillus massiliensis]